MLYTTNVLLMPAAPGEPQLIVLKGAQVVTSLSSGEVFIVRFIRKQIFVTGAEYPYKLSILFGKDSKHYIAIDPNTTPRWKRCTLVSMYSVPIATALTRFWLLDIWKLKFKEIA